MNEKINLQFLKPFGPFIAKTKISSELINKLNEYYDKISNDTDLSKIQDHGHSLAGNVSHEIKIDDAFVEKSGLLKFLATNSKAWIENTIVPKKLIHKQTPKSQLYFFSKYSESLTHR